jgi:HEAT repeat protein
MKRWVWIGCAALGLVTQAARADEGSVTPVAIAGIDPRIYLRAMRPEPHALLELKRLPVDVSVAILEGHAARYLTDVRAYPKDLAQVEIELLREDETRALVEGALAAVASKHHPRATPLIEAWLADNDARVRAAAAERYGEVGGELKALLTLADDVDPRVRAGACLGMGKLRTEAAVDALAQLARDDKDVGRQIAAVRGIGLAGTAPANGTFDEGVAQAVASKARLALVVLEPTEPAVQAAVDEAVARFK